MEGEGEKNFIEAEGHKDQEIANVEKGVNEMRIAEGPEGRHGDDEISVLQGLGLQAVGKDAVEEENV